MTVARWVIKCDNQQLMGKKFDITFDKQTGTISPSPAGISFSIRPYTLTKGPVDGYAMSTIK
jgi:hypothetical protein